MTWWPSSLSGPVPHTPRPWTLSFSVILVGVELVFLLAVASKEWQVKRSVLGHALLAATCSGLAFLPWVLYATPYQITRSSNWPALPPFTLGRWFQAIAAVLAFGPPESFQPGADAPATLALAIVLATLATLGAVLTIQQTLGIEASFSSPSRRSLSRRYGSQTAKPITSSWSARLSSCFPSSCCSPVRDSGKLCHQLGKQSWQSERPRSLPRPVF